MGQLEQLAKDDEDAYAPIGHLEQTDEEAAEYEPAAHTPVIAVRPTVAQYEPAVQVTQLVEPEVDWKLPAWHFEQFVAEAAEYDPTSHSPVTAVSPDVSQYDPAMQSEQFSEPATGL